MVTLFEYGNNDNVIIESPGVFYLETYEFHWE